MDEMVSNITSSLIQKSYGVGFYVDGNPVFERPRLLENSTVKILLTSKTPVVGVFNSTKLWGPYLIEVRVWQ